MLPHAETALDGIAGLQRGIALLRGYVDRYWDTIHPQLEAQDDFDPLFRVNALAPLVSFEGLIGILRRADPTYSTADNYGTRAQNASGYFVDLFCPELDPAPDRMTPKDRDPISTEGAERNEERQDQQPIEAVA